MHTFYEILQTPNREGETTIVFFTNGKRYLFNASENLHRFCTECGVRVFSGLEHIFIPHISPSYLGGLPGALITASETSTTNKFHLYGPPNLWHYLTSLRQFVKTPISFKIMLNIMMEHQVEEDYLMLKDENISVRGILLKSENTSRREDYHKLLPSCDFGGPFALRNSSGNFIKHSHEKEMAWDFLFQNKNRKGQDLSPSKKKLKKEPEEFYYSFKNRLNIQPIGELNANQGHVDTLREMLKYINPTLNDYCMCYVCKTADVPGKFDSNKAAELGVFGMMRGKLARGETIVVNGITVKPEDVIDPPTPGSEVLIINCPNESYLKNLVTHKQFDKYYSKSTSVIHCVSHEILITPVYQNFMRRFSQDCDHVIVNEDSSKPASSFVSSCTNIVEFSLVDKDLFTLCLNPNHNQNSELHQKSLTSIYSNTKITYGESLMKYVLIPTRNKGFDVSKVPYIREIMPSSVESNFYQSYPTIAKYLREYLDKFSDNEYALNETHSQAKILQQCGDQEFEIIFLGTGSSVPSKYRNVTGILLNLFDKGAILFDCGEGTLSQIYRACGKERAESILKNLKCIWISHLHADHHLGLAYLLEKRSKLTSDDVVIVGQGRIKEALSEYLVCSSDTKFNFDFVPMQTLEPERYCPEKILLDRVINPLGLKSFINVPVDHTCAEAYGIVITHQNGWKVVFSGDTRPCSRLIKAGKDCTVLIHEATFEASMIKDAISKKHTCSFEAIAVGEQMNAYRTILTHFSQRYCKFPIVDSQKTDYALKNVAVAHDLMRLNAKKLISIPKVMQVLKHFWTIIEMDSQNYAFDFDEEEEKK